jgi:1-aminocyclopropane-1-carboxylate deaminase/D-cysteine desulfhydrase-like pyridoxal-dependent ACC family enzyme
MTYSSFYLDHTPIETHRLRDRVIYVKREDLYSSAPAPPLAKLRGLRVLLTRLCGASVSLVGCFQTRVSNIGHGLAAACLEFPSLRCIVVCPRAKGQPDPASAEMARSLGATVNFVPANRLAINYTQARRYVEGKGGVMLPFGMECREAVECVASEAARVPHELVHGATIVLSCGSGVTLAGLLKGLPVSPRRIVGVSSGRALGQIERCITRHVSKLPDNVQLVPASVPYHQAPVIGCPFPCHPHYDLKAWEHLLCHLDDYEDPILFWNVGG